MGTVVSGREERDGREGVGLKANGEIQSGGFQSLWGGRVEERRDDGKRKWKRLCCDDRRPCLWMKRGKSDRRGVVSRQRWVG